MIPALIPALILLVLVLCSWYLLRSRVKANAGWKKAFESGKFDGIAGEPFPGALCICGLVTCIFRDDMIATRMMEKEFSRRYFADWTSMCRAAINAKSLNNDLLTENLAKILLKNKDPDLLKKIFDVLQASEFAWGGENEKPSVYLSQLLHYEVLSDEKIQAYHILGLEKGASAEKIKSAYRKLSARYHPDKESGNEQMFIKVTEAYNLLTNK